MCGGRCGCGVGGVGRYGGEGGVLELGVWEGMGRHGCASVAVGVGVCGGLGVCARGRGCGCEFAGARSALNVSICESEVTPSDVGRMLCMWVVYADV